MQAYSSEWVILFRVLTVNIYVNYITRACFQSRTQIFRKKKNSKNEFYNKCRKTKIFFLYHTFCLQMHQGTGMMFGINSSFHSSVKIFLNFQKSQLQWDNINFLKSTNKIPCVCFASDCVWPECWVEPISSWMLGLRGSWKVSFWKTEFELWQSLFYFFLYLI